MSRKTEYRKEELLQHLLELESELGRIPAGSDMNEAENRPAQTTYHRYFSSWNDALAEAGLETYNERTSYDREELLGYLEEFAQEYGKSPSIEEMSNVDKYPSANTYMSYFGSWNDALREADLQPNQTGPKEYSETELIQHLKELADELGQNPTSKDMKGAQGRPSPTTYRKNFDSWNNALQKANLSLNKHRSDADELIKHLQELASELGRTPTAMDMKKDKERPSSVYYYKVFDSWNDALREADLEVNKKGNGKYKTDKLLNHLREFAAEIGKTPSKSEMESADDRPSARTYQNRFESWNNALREADLK